jgi:hypothetical protein
MSENATHHRSNTEGELMMEGFLIPITLFLSTAAVLIVWLTVRYRERVTMVEKGLSAEDIKSLYERSTKRNHLSSLKWGMLFVFGGIAIILGNILHDYFAFDEEGAIFGMVAIFLGVALLLYYRIASKEISQL